MNTVLILYVTISIALKMTIAGLDFLDSLPIMFYILPLMVILPSLTYAYYSDRTAAINFIIILISSAFFYVLSALVRGFMICLLLNILALGIMFIMGRFRPQGNLRNIGKKGIAWFIILNLLGLAFPISVNLMGQNPITYIEQQEVPIELEIPLAEERYLEPNSTMIANFIQYDFEPNLLLYIDDEDSWNRLSHWLNTTNNTLSTTVSFIPDRSNLAGFSNSGILNTEFFTSLYQSHNNSLKRIRTMISNLNLIFPDLTIRFDMTLSGVEWNAFMAYIKNVDLTGFSSLIRQSFDSLNITALNELQTSLMNQIDWNMMNSGFILESFVLDDFGDGDTLLSSLCGVTNHVLSAFSQLENIYDIRRSRFSSVMNGDVGEYLAHSYSRTAGLLESGVRIGDITSSAYENSQLFLDDLHISSGNGVAMITISSLNGILGTELFGNLSDFRTAIDEDGTVGVTYTFRIYAYRAVFMAIDAFDFLIF